MNNLEKTIGYSFHDKDLLKTALTHSSYLKDKCLDEACCNERLEFIGDGFLDAIIGNYLFEAMKDRDEGSLSKIRSAIVCEKTLAKFATKINLGEYLLLGKGEEKAGGRNKDSIKADCVEALIGAIYKDSSYETIEKLVLTWLANDIKEAMAGRLLLDYKSQLQEMVQAENDKLEIEYRTLKEEGPDHNKIFTIQLFIGGKAMGIGKGKKKKDAEQEAAQETINKEMFKGL
ncbi:MAG: ribonuclease III [Clostridia bacterium]|nr:ribonuclease III [Clostridia bacterium]